MDDSTTTTGSTRTWDDGGRAAAWRELEESTRGSAATHLKLLALRHPTSPVILEAIEIVARLVEKPLVVFEPGLGDNANDGGFASSSSSTSGDSASASSPPPSYTYGGGRCSSTRARAPNSTMTTSPMPSPPDSQSPATSAGHLRRRGLHRAIRSGGHIPSIAKRQFDTIIHTDTRVETVLHEVGVARAMGAALVAGMASVQQEGSVGGVAGLESIVLLEALPAVHQLTLCPPPPELAQAEQYVQKFKHALDRMATAVLAADDAPSKLALNTLSVAIEDAHTAGYTAGNSPEVFHAEEVRDCLVEWVGRTDALAAAQDLASTKEAVIDMRLSAAKIGTFSYTSALVRKVEQLEKGAPRADVQGVWDAVLRRGIKIAASMSGQLDAVAGLLEMDRASSKSSPQAKAAARGRELARRLESPELYVKDVFSLLQSAPGLRTRARILLVQIAAMMRGEGGGREEEGGHEVLVGEGNRMANPAGFIVAAVRDEKLTVSKRAPTFFAQVSRLPSVPSHHATPLPCARSTHTTICPTKLLVPKRVRSLA